jgi:serine/threonine protein kinase
MSDQHQREAAIIDAALELPPDQRTAYLERACGDDAALRQRLEALLKACEQTRGFLEKPAASMLRQAPALSTPLAEKPGDTIGRYKLLQQIGEGGCGVVYMAEQEEPVRRRVALKVIKLGMDTKSVIARFDAERQALAMMDHPNIAKVFDAGSTERPLTRPAGTLSPSGGGSGGEGRGEGDTTLSTGRPYFVMELVRGVKITEYCDQNNLTTKERLDLFMQVCRAIQHAHQKGIIHRDIKPSNILVTLHDGVPVPKVIDFGIAKATQGRLTDQTLFTAFQQFIGTPAYMSPEQAEMSGLDIDTRSDIYSLGVLLYELLTGKTPFDGKELVAAGVDAMRRTIREKEPQPPSTRLTQELVAADVRRLKSSASDDVATKEGIRASSRRLLRARELINSIRGDLDWIVMRCLEKDRTRRYETANGLASDIQRHLSSEAVLACPPSNLYRFQKLVRRNKLAFAAAACIGTALVIGLGISSWMFLREKQARQRAVAAEREQLRLRESEAKLRVKSEVQEQKAKSEAEILKDMLSAVNPIVALGRDTTILREILDKASERVSKELPNQPEVEAELCSIIGEAYRAIREDDKAEKMFREGLAAARKLPGTETACLATSLKCLGWFLWMQYCFVHKSPETLAEGEWNMREALRIRRTVFGDEHPAVAEVLVRLGLMPFGKS